jgi:preprotein translocase SecF subunit
VEASGAPAESASGSPAATASGSPAAPASGAPSAAAATAAERDISSALLARETIDPIIGHELFTNSLLALVVALILQLLYITLRFGNQLRYGLAADVALIHDVIIMAGLYSLTSRQVDSPFLAALLTVIGYSVMDSIVVFDRIRENVRHSRKGNYAEICNASVNQTMSRSVNTTLTVLLTLFALYFFGGDTLRNFAFALLVGITSGAYSSIFIATPLVVIFDDWTKKKEEERVSERRRAREAAASSRSEAAASRAESSEGAAPMRRRSTDAGGGDDYPEPGEVEDSEPRRPGAARRRKTRRRRP